MRLDWIRKASEAIFQTQSDADKLVAERGGQSLWLNVRREPSLLRFQRSLSIRLARVHWWTTYVSERAGWFIQGLLLFAWVLLFHLEADSSVGSSGSESACLAYLQFQLFPPWTQQSISEKHVLAVCFFLHLYLLPSPPPHPWWVSRGERNHNFDGVLFFQQPSRALAHTIKNNNGTHRWSRPGSKRLIRDCRPLLTPHSC